MQSTDALADKLLKNWVGRDSRTRLRHFPFRVIAGRAVPLAKKFRISFPISARMPWGGRFYGLFPEAVTFQLWRLRFYDTRASVFVREHLKPGQCFVDVGAHFGYFTLLASRIVGDAGKVIAVEPTPSSYALLVANIERNNLANVCALPFAADEKAGTLSLTDFGPIYSTLNTSDDVRGDVPEHIERKHFDARAVRLDDEIGAQVVHMVKIDVEGHEIEALRGMQQALTRDRPIVLIECGGKSGDRERDRVREIFAFMAERGYGANESDGRTLTPISVATKNPKRNDVVFTHR